MTLSNRARDLIAEIDHADTKRGELKKRARTIKKDHELAKELWSTGKFQPRLLAALIFDRKELTQDIINGLAKDMQEHDEAECHALSEWLMANQLMKDKRLVGLLEIWQENPDPLLRRLFWYHQARLRWVGQAPPENTEDLLHSLEDNMGSEKPVVQWAMNMCAAWIGVHDPKHRSRCIRLGKDLALYKDEVVPKNCTPNYLPEFIRIEAAKVEA